jgi:hypothetical protein
VFATAFAERVEEKNGAARQRGLVPVCQQMK